MHGDDTSSDAGWGLLTDLYELTMALGYWRHGLAEREAVFHMSFREHPFGGSYTLACGLAHACDLLDDYGFTSGDVDYLATLLGGDQRPLFPPDFLAYLAELRLTCDIDAIEEGTVVFPNEPLVRVRGPLLQGQLLESLLLNVINFQTLVATKAARVCRAAGAGSVLEFGLRRAQGENGALAASRAAYIGGCHATSNVLAGRRYGIPVRGTHAHSWVLAFDSECEAFARYAEALPNNCIFLVDTFDTLRGVERAIEVARQLRADGHRLVGIRLDSGDIAALSRQARDMLDAAELRDAVIVASNDLDEYQINALKEQGARVDIWGVGTRLVTAYDQPALGGVYKLSALRDSAGLWQHKVKRSEEAIKASTPGILQVRRYEQDARFLADVIYDELTGLSERGIDDRGDSTPHSLPLGAQSRELLVPIYRAGKRVYRHPALTEMQGRAREQLDRLACPEGADEGWSGYHVCLEEQLFLRRQRLIAAGSETGA